MPALFVRVFGLLSSKQREAKRFIAATSLPPEVRSSINLTVKQTRLWSSERLDLARELCAHFADGLQAGRSPDRLITDFGDPACAARLIRRAKLRARPMWWRTAIYFAKSSAAVMFVALLTYAVLAYRFYFGIPTIRRNYAAELNVAALAIPRDQRAWPLYIQAVRELGVTPQFVLDGNPWPAHAGDPGWNEAAAHLAAHPNAVPMIRKAAAMPVLGYILANDSDPEYMRALEVRNPGYKYDPTQESHIENPVMIGILLPYLGEFRNMTRILLFDLTAGAQAKDHARVAADLEAMLGMADHCMHSSFLIDTQVSMAIADVACRAALEHLTLLSDEELPRIAHRFAAFAGGRVRFDPDHEQMMFQDLVQRFFTDDGHGDGHIIRGRLKELRIDFGMTDEESRRLHGMTMPLRTALIPSRAEITALHNQLLASIRADDAIPLWKSDQRSNTSGLGNLYGKYLGMLFPFESLVGDSGEMYSRLFIDRDLFEARRSALLAACAIESYRRARHAYPPDLAALVPSLLPTIPIDPFDGKPLRYKLSADGGTFFLYSIGVDQSDDGGRSPAEPGNREKVFDAQKLKAFREQASHTSTDAASLDLYRGDWVIYPPLSREPAK